MPNLFIERDGQLVQMTDLPFTSEDVFQALLGRHPALLEGDLLAPDREPRTFVLVSREMAVPDSAGGGGRWSLDHLFLDQEGIPTLVEVKRSSDTRIRREVVGQVLDYAANATAYWPPEALKERLDATHKDNGGGDAQLRVLLGLEDFSPEAATAAIESYWQTVATNLTAGRVRLLFVADRIERELRRIIEFMNEQMSPAEVLGVEIRNYEGEGFRALTPVVVGLTEAAQERKAVLPKNEQSIDERWAGASPETRAAAQLLDDWADSHDVTHFDEGASRRYIPAGARLSPIMLYPTDRLAYFNFDRIDPQRRNELRAALSNLVGREVRGTGQPSVKAALIAERWAEFESQFLTLFSQAAASFTED